MKRNYINFQEDNYLTSNEKRIMATIAQRLKRRRLITDQPEEEIFQNNNEECKLTAQQKGALFEEECQEQLRENGITCTLSSASKWRKKDQKEYHKTPRKYVFKYSKPDQDFELIISGDHGIDAFGHSQDRKYIAQFKNHKQPIGPKDVRDFIGTLSAYKGSIGIFISKNGFSQNAICEFKASEQPIIYDTHISINIKELIINKKPLILTQSFLTADKFKGTINFNQGIIQTEKATNLIIQTQTIS